MNVPLDKPMRSVLESVSLDDKYKLEKGRAYMSGTQALVRLLMFQKAHDKRAGRVTCPGRYWLPLYVDLDGSQS